VDPVLLVMLGAWLLVLPTVGWADSLGRRAAGAQYLNPGQGMGMGMGPMGMGYEGNVRGKVMMGEQNKDCDDTKTKLEVDWADQPVDYTCYHPTTPLLPSSLPPVLQCDPVPENYQPKHFCMDTKISYNVTVPTHGDHRPNWPVFGEYQYVPPQRWLHNIEHGAVVMLYHPCTHHTTLQQLRSLVTGCIRKHVITAHPGLTEDRPLALVAWGCRLLMSSVDSVQVAEFIRQRALHGPEGSYPKEGQYTHGLIKKAEIPAGSTNEDSVLCPSLPKTMYFR